MAKIRNDYENSWWPRLLRWLDGGTDQLDNSKNANRHDEENPLRNYFFIGRSLTAASCLSSFSQRSFSIILCFRCIHICGLATSASFRSGTDQ